MLNRGARDEHRLHIRTGRELAGFADLPINANEFRFRLLGRILVRNAPARELTGVPELFLQIDPIDTDDHAIYTVRKLSAVGAKFFDHLPYGIDRFTLARDWIGRNSPSIECCHKLTVRGERVSSDLAAPM